MEQMKNKFIQSVADVFEVKSDTISFDTEFRKIKGFSSLMGFSLIIMIEDDYGVNVPVEEFMKCQTIGDLFKTYISK